MIRPPSLFKPYDEFYSGDAAIVQLDPNANPEQCKAHANALRVARETGNWEPILVPGMQPTRFKLRQLTAEQAAALNDYQTAGDGTNLTAVVTILGVRCALIGIAGFPHPDSGKDWEVRPVNDARFPVLGRIAAPDITDAIWNLRDEDGNLYGPQIIGELFAVIRDRANGLYPKS